MKVANEVEKTLRDISSMCHPVGQPSLIVMNKLISREPEFVEDVLVELIFDHKL